MTWALSVDSELKRCLNYIHSLDCSWTYNPATDIYFLFTKKIKIKKGKKEGKQDIYCHYIWFGLHIYFASCLIWKLSNPKLPLQIQRFVWHVEIPSNSLVILAITFFFWEKILAINCSSGWDWYIYTYIICTLSIISIKVYTIICTYTS